MQKRPFLAVTGVASLNGGGSVKTPTANVNDTSIINAAWARNLIQSYGLGAGLSTSPSISTALNDIDTTGFYTLSGEFTDGPSGLSTISAQLLHMERRFGAGTTGFQLLPHSNQIFYRTRNQDAWGGWSTVASQAWVQGQIDDLTTLTDDGVRVVASPDYNALVDPGFYHCNSTGQQNGPGGAYKMIVLTTKAEAPKHATQIAFPIASTNLTCPAFRGMDGEGVWTEWRKLLLAESNEKIIVGDTISATSTATKGTTPSGVRWSFLAIQDAAGGTLEGTRLAMIGHRYGPDGSVRARVACYKPDSGSTDSVSIDVGYDANGNAYATAPATASTAKGQEIATASFVMEKHRRVHFCNRKLATRQTEKGT